jgi:phytoene/squalene synthetase
MTPGRRAWLLWAGARLDRDRPDLDGLARLDDAERFLWRILPHAARTFAACIALLPTEVARAAAVGYLYCRILDSYEDLHPDPDQRDRALAAFASRFEDGTPPPAPDLPAIDGSSIGGIDARDAAHLLLVRRCHLVDRVWENLPAGQRLAVRDVVADMAAGMRWAGRLFVDQGGVLVDDTQLLRYCRHVIGHPVVFTLRLLRGNRPDAALTEESMRVGEMVQLANVTRDIEKDLRRGIAYHPELRAWLGSEAPDATAVASVREHLLRLALARAPAYRAVLAAADVGGLPRTSALLMLLFTERHYRGCARRVGWSSWRGSDSWRALLLRAAPALLSPAYAHRVCRSVERRFLESLQDDAGAD